MKLRNDRELANTRNKLADLERLIQRAKDRPSPGQATELRSLTRLANQLREELSRYASAVPSKPTG
jgi:hypothetical protein